MRTRNILLIISAALLLGSCKKSFLELNSPSNLTTAVYWKTADDLNAGLATIYSELVHDYNGHYGTVNWELGECRSDNFNERHDVQDRYDISTFSNTSSNGSTQSLYAGPFICIFYANQVIKYGEAMTLDASIKDPLIAEARFLRALNYWFLVSDFGEVPLVLTVPQSSADYFPAKSSKDLIWQQIISDFKDAEQNLPVTRPAGQAGRATKGAAEAYLGRMYLYKVHDDAGNATAIAADYAAAQAVLKTVVDNHVAYGFDLQANFAELFDGNHKNGKEGIFELQFNANLGGPTIWTPNNVLNASKTRADFIAKEIMPLCIGGWGEMYPTEVLLNKFLVEKDKDGNFDPRATATLAWDYPGCTYYQRNFDSVANLKDNYWDFHYKAFLKKGQNWWLKAESGDNKSSLDEYGMRYADVLLMLAEAYTMNTGDVTSAAPLVQQVRSRANLADNTAAITASTAAMMTEIKHQRDLEFAREGLRFYDMRRWGDLSTAMAAATDKDGYQNFSLKYEYYPIPLTELQTNASMTQSTPWK